MDDREAPEKPVRLRRTTQEQRARSSNSPSASSGSATFVPRRKRGKTRPRTYYTLTEKGLTALQDWLAWPSRFPRIQNEAVARVLASDLASDQAGVVRSLEALREEIADPAAGVDEAERRAPTIPHRERQLRLVRSLGRRLLQTHLEWIDEVERELGQPGDEADRSAKPS